MTRAAVETELHVDRGFEADGRWWLGAPMLLIGVFLPIFNFCMINETLPAIGLDMGATTLAQFIVSACAAVHAIMIATSGDRLGGLLGSRCLFSLGAIGFMAASVAGGVTWATTVLAGGCVVQGVAMIIMAPHVLDSIRSTFPATDEGRVLALYAGAFALASICGELLGGIFTLGRPYGLAWQAVFFMSVPAGLVTLGFHLPYAVKSRTVTANKFNVGGVIMIGTFYLLFALYFHGNLDQFRFAAALTTLPFVIAFVGSSLVSAYVVQTLGKRAVTFSFVLRAVGFGALMLSLSAFLPERFGLGSICG
jgi:MFS family permease